MSGALLRSVVLRSTLLALLSGSASCALSPAPADEDHEAAESAFSRKVHLAAMAPLVIGRLDAPHDPAHEAEWARFTRDLEDAKALGIESVSVDVWWGAVERTGDQEFDFRWVDRAATAITGAGLQFRPVLAFHSCGTNVGDDCNVALPPWVFARYRDRDVPGVGRVRSQRDLLYVSAQGNVSHEALSVWATPLVIEQYRELFQAFAARYAHLADRTSGIAIGLGPASELRYPSYNAHDHGAGYPGPGVLQAYSTLAQGSFRAWALAKHGSPEGVAAAWSRPIATAEAIRLPDPASLEGFYARGDHMHTAFGRDVFEWYRGSLLDHGRLVLSAAADVFQSSAFRGVRLSARVPGVHWRAGDSRRAELSAGLISTSDASGWARDDEGHGYAPLVAMLAGVRARANRPNVALEYTCLEMGNGEGGPAVASMAEALVFWIGDAARRRGVPIGGENALAGGLWTEHGWGRIRNALTFSHYDELTLLRLSDVVRSPTARREVRRLAAR
jgi:beta-amylase